MALTDNIDISPDPIITQTWDEAILGQTEQVSPGSQPSTGTPVQATPAIVAVASDYRSPNFVPNLSGWELGSNGVIRAIGVILSGDISAVTGHIANWAISGSALSTGAFDTLNTMYFGTSGLSLSNTFKVDNAGALTATGATISGAITATSGSFTGAITATSGTIGGFTIAGTNLSAGSGVTRIDLDTGAGISLGASTFATAPFSVTLAGVLKAESGTIGGTTITDTTLYGGIIQTSATVGAGSNGVIMDTSGIRMFDDTLGMVVNLPSDGSRPTFASGDITLTNFLIDTELCIRTADTVGDGSINSAGILINNAGIFACGASQTLANANVKILIDGSAVIKMNVKGGQTDFNTGIGYFLGLSGGEYKQSIGDPNGDHFNWDGHNIKLVGSLNVGANGLMNNAVYTNATLPVPPTVVGWAVASSYE